MANKKQETCSLYDIDKNEKFCDVFSNMTTPMILLDGQFNIKNMNKSVREIIRGQKICESKCKGTNCKEEIISWIYDEIVIFPESLKEIEFKKEIVTPRGKRHFIFNVRKMLQGNDDGYIITIDDHTEKDIAQDFMDHSFQIAKTISKISQRFVGVYDMDKEICQSLKDIGKNTAADRVHIFQFSDDMKIMNNTHEWCGEDITPQIENLQGVQTNGFPWWMSKIEEGKFIHIEDIDKMPLEAKVEKDLLKNQQIKSLLALPLRIKEKVIGFLDIDYVHDKRLGNYDLLLLNLVIEVFNNVFERQAMENKLKKSEQLFRELLNSANDFIFFHRISEDKASRKFTMVNENVCKFLGFTREELLLLGPQDIVSLEYKDSIEKILSVISKDGKHKFEVALCSKSGEEIPVEINAHVYLNSGEKTVMSIARDIRERKQAEEVLRRSEMKYRKLVEASPDAILIHERRIITFANRQAIKLFKAKDINDLIGKDISILMSSKCKETTLNRIGHMIKTNVNIVEEELITLDGEVIIAEVSATNLEQLPSSIIQTVIRDITTRKNAEQEIHLLYQAVEQSSSAIVVTDPDGKIKYVNSKFQKLTGYTLNEIISENPRILKSGKQPMEIYSGMWESIISGKEWHGEFWNKKKNGELYWVLVSISPVRNKDGYIVNYLAIQEDITERKNMEEELKRVNSEFREMIDKLEITQMHLIQKEKMAGIGQLAAGIAHEINNPLGFTMSNLNILGKHWEKYKEIMASYKILKGICMDGLFDNLKTQVEYIDHLEKKYKVKRMNDDIGELLKESNEGLERISKIVKGLRIFSRIDQQNELEEFDLNHAIENALLVATNEIKFCAAVEKNLGEISSLYGSPGQISQVLLNLILNACYAIKSNSPIKDGVITINTYKKNNNVYCEVKDNGVGIPKDIINQIFNPFFTTKPVGEGTGLGLSISYDIVKNKHHGDIQVESIKSVGTKFTLEFPCTLGVKSASYHNFE